MQSRPVRVWRNSNYLTFATIQRNAKKKRSDDYHVTRRWDKTIMESGVHRELTTLERAEEIRGTTTRREKQISALREKKEIRNWSALLL